MIHTSMYNIIFYLWPKLTYLHRIFTTSCPMNASLTYRVWTFTKLLAHSHHSTWYHYRMTGTEAMLIWGNVVPVVWTRCSYARPPHTKNGVLRPVSWWSASPMSQFFFVRGVSIDSVSRIFTRMAHAGAPCFPMGWQKNWPHKVNQIFRVCRGRKVWHNDTVLRGFDEVILRGGGGRKTFDPP